MTISEKFKAFNSNILINENEINTIANRYKRITNALNEEYYGYSSETSNSLYVGSYGRDTDIHTSDVDILFIMPLRLKEKYNNYVGNGQSALLQNVKEKLLKTYSSTNMSGDGQVVVINFIDGIRFELVPCFRKIDEHFTYPDTHNGGSWKTTKPRAEIRQIQETNNSTNKNLKRLCRMARAWRDNVGLNMGGLLIDTLCYDFLKSWQYRSSSFVYYDWLTRDFFKYLKDQDPSRSSWLAVGSNQVVYAKAPFHKVAKEAYENAILAIEKEEAELHYTANIYWKKIYGNKFI